MLVSNQMEKVETERVRIQDILLEFALNISNCIEELVSIHHSINYISMLAFLLFDHRFGMISVLLYQNFIEDYYHINFENLYDLGFYKH